MALNLHLLRIFTSVATTRSFSQAAKQLYISQPAVSRAVQELERQVDVMLIDRSITTFTLTEAGRVLYQHGLQIFAAERAAETALAELQGLVRGELTVGASQTIGTYLLPARLRQFHRLYPGVRLMLDILNTHQIIERLINAPLDLAYVEGPVVDMPNLIVTPWRVDTLVVIAAPDHPLVDKQPLGLNDILAEPFIMREVGSGTRENIELALGARRLHLNIAMELGGTSAIKEAVAAGLGISIVSEATIKLERKVGALVVLEVSDFILTRTMSQIMVSQRPLSRAAAIFQSMLQETGE